MARSINKAILVGYLGLDPELRYTPSGTPVCKLRLATSEVFHDAQGNLVERTEWHNLVAWARLAEIANQYLRKGSKVYVEGQLRARSYEKDGHTFYVTEIYVRQLVLLDRPASTGDGAGVEQVEVRPAKNVKAAPKTAAKAAKPTAAGAARRVQQVRQQVEEQFDAAPVEDEGYSLEPDDDLPF